MGERSRRGRGGPAPPGGHRRAPAGMSPQQALGPEGVKAAAVATLSPHTVIQTTHSASEPLPVGLPATAFYAGTQPPVIGYLSSQQQAITYTPTSSPTSTCPRLQIGRASCRERVSSPV